MASTQAEAGRILAALQGNLRPFNQQQSPASASPAIAGSPSFENGGSTSSSGNNQQSAPTLNRGSHHSPAFPQALGSPSVGAAQAADQQQSGIWQVPASVGFDLTNPTILGTIISLWPTLEEVQKINTLLGIAHVGQGKMGKAHAEAMRISELAKSDTSSDWVRTLGCIIGDVGSTGKITLVESISQPTRTEIEKAVDELAAVLERADLQLTTESLGYVSNPVARKLAPASIRNANGRRPRAAELEKIMGDAKKRAAALQSPSTSRRPSMAHPAARRPSAATDNAGGSASSSRLGSPEASDADFAAFSELFAENGDGGIMDVSDEEDSSGHESDSGDGTQAVYASRPRSLRLYVKESHRTDHVGRMARLLVAAKEGIASTAQHGGSGDARRPSIPTARGARAGSGIGAAGLGMRRGAPGTAASAGPSSKIGMLAPRRRGAPSNLALPSAALGTSGTTQAIGKKIQMMDFKEAAISANDRERLLKAKREQAAEEREAKRAKVQAEKDERKRQREEARQKKLQDVDKPGSTVKRGRGRPRKTRNEDEEGDSSEPSDGEYANGDAAESGATSNNEAASPTQTTSRQSRSPDQSGFDVPLDYLTFTGNDPQVCAVYASTNALTDENRLLMYCFFNAQPFPPNTENNLEVVLNEQTIDDPSHPGKTCRELMVFQADRTKGEWRKVRRLRRT
ncbi:hypothetical protein BX070DRAFT_224978 [Coemansia spiralis]|nr:hypothetical protein BX070DRAFT_224978 [Coemansia spiralis]